LLRERLVTAGETSTEKKKEQLSVVGVVVGGVELFPLLSKLPRSKWGSLLVPRVKRKSADWYGSTSTTNFQNASVFEHASNLLHYN
jgi:hypothetical protein